MKPKKALNLFNELKSKYEKGDLKEKKFKKKVSKIKVKTLQGVEWKVDFTGQWYKNVNNTWVKDELTIRKNQGPQTLFQLIKLIIKSIFTNLPKRLLFLGVIAGISFLIHTYMVIYPNGGYWPGTNPILDKVLALKGNMARGTIFWTVLSYLIISLFRRFKSVGVKVIISGLYKGPKRVINSMTKGKNIFFTFYSISLPILLLISHFLIKNIAIAYIIMIGSILAIICFRADLSYLILRLGYQDFARLFNKKNRNFNDIYFDSFQIALISSMAIYALMPYKPISLYIIAAISIALLIYIKLKNKNEIIANLILLGFIGLNFEFLTQIISFADDGGVVEAGGFIPWITSPGAFTAVTIGTPPAIGSGLGALIGLVTNSNGIIDTFIDTYDETLEDINEGVDILEDTYDDTVEDISDGIDILEDTLDGTIEDIGDGLEALGEELDILSDMDIIGDHSIDSIMDDLYDNFFGDPTERLDSMISLADLGLDAIKDTGGLISDLQDSILTSDAMDTIFDAYDNYIPDWFEQGAADTAGEVWDYMGATKDMIELAGYLPDDTPISDIMDYAGIAKDAFENIGLGDNAAYAGIKSFLSNKFKGAIFDKNPGLKIMDALTTVFAGGSDAANIISPGKTIQGSANFVIDKITDLVNGTNDVDSRLDNGNYGGVLQVADDTSEVIADAVYNQDARDAYTNAVTDDSFYEGMYETNAQLWKPKEGSWAIKRAGCYVGQKTFDSLIGVAEGVKNISWWLGSKL